MKIHYNDGMRNDTARTSRPQKETKKQTKKHQEELISQKVIMEERLETEPV